MIKKYLRNLSVELQELIFSASRLASGNNARVYLVGGCVRDMILGVNNFDLDIVIEGPGVRIAEELARELNVKLTTHQRFGTATVFLEHNQKVDIATARREIYPQPASLPVVSSGSIKDDLFRRDFSINAMAIDIDAEDFGALLDLFGGRSDIHNKKIRVLHNLSFIDDPTRMLRAIRFEQRYHFKIEPVTFRALKEAAGLGMLEKVGPQRVRDEIILLLKEDDPLKQVRRTQGLIGLGFIHPKLRASRKIYSLLHSVKKEIKWFRKQRAALNTRRLKVLRRCPLVGKDERVRPFRAAHQRRDLDIWLIYFMGLLDPLDISQTKQVLKKFVFRKGEENRLLDYKRISRGLIHKLSQDDIKPSQIFCLLKLLSYEAILLIKAKFRHKRLQKNIADFLKIYNGMRIHISGDDLCGMGVEPGPCYQKIFAKALAAKLDGLVSTKEEELALARRLIGKP